MSLEDREKLFEEVNGIPTIVHEDPEFVTKSLEELDTEINKVKMDKSAYHLAMSLRPEWKTNHNFRLMFLRAEEFQAKPAAEKMQRFFDVKLELFGQDKLCRPITLDDFNEEDMECLRNGHFHFSVNVLLFLLHKS